MVEPDVVVFDFVVEFGTEFVFEVVIIPQLKIEIEIRRYIDFALNYIVILIWFNILILMTIIIFFIYFN